MSFTWMIGAIYFYYHWERHDPGPEYAPEIENAPLISILIPCFNEGENAVDTISAALAQNYPDFEVIAINDGSKDDTAAILDRLAIDNPRLRVVHLAANQGKAMALRMGALVARAANISSVWMAMLCCIAMPQPIWSGLLSIMPVWAPSPAIPAFVRDQVLLGKIQVGEFASIIGLIKRAQRVYGNVFTVSGVIAAFRRSALHRVGYWSLDMITEDIDVSWLLQMDHWSIQYEPNALCWILMPETFRGLWKQRLRWAQGGTEVFFEACCANLAMESPPDVGNHDRIQP